MAFAAPVIGEIARRVFDHADADVSEAAGAPYGMTGFARVKGRLDVGPIRHTEGNV
jgi:hypothetical protein